MPPNIISFSRRESITSNQVEMPPEKTAMDEDGLPSLIEQGDGIIRDFRFVQQRPDSRRGMLRNSSLAGYTQF